MKIKFDKYWGNAEKINKLIFFVVIYDPGYKLQTLHFSLKTLFGEIQGLELFKDVQRDLDVLFDEYNCMYGISAANVSSLASQTNQSAILSNTAAAKKKPAVSLMKARFRQQMLESGNSWNKLNEVEMYLNEVIIEVVLIF